MLPQFFEAVAEWIGFLLFFLTKYSHETRCRHHHMLSFLSVVINLVQLILSKQEHLSNEATLISMKCKVTTQNWKQIRNVVLWFCSLSFPHVTSLPPFYPASSSLAFDVEALGLSCRCPPHLPHSSSPDPSTFLNECFAWGGLKESQGCPPWQSQHSLGSSASRPPITDTRTTHTYSWFCVFVCVLMSKCVYKWS